MSFWNTDLLIERGKDLITPFEKSNIEQCAYELTVGNEYYETSMTTGKKVLREGEQIRIRPGQLALLMTRKKVRVPLTQIAFISIKFSLKKRGLINVSGFHVDPGFSGKLKFSVYNAGPRTFTFDIGQKLFLIWFSELVGPSEEYNGAHDGQKEITADDVTEFEGDVASPAQLKLEVDELRGRLETLKLLGLAVLAALLGPIAVLWITRVSAFVETLQSPATTVAGVFLIFSTIVPWVLVVAILWWRTWRARRRKNAQT
jgi:dCTP deaminase